MKKPNFPIGGRVAWTPLRVAYVRHLAEVCGMSARGIADECGVPNPYRIYQIAKRHKINLHVRQFEPSHNIELRVMVGEDRAAALTALASKYHKNRSEIVSLMVEGLFEQGQTFCENMLDIEE